MNKNTKKLLIILFATLIFPLILYAYGFVISLLLTVPVTVFLWSIVNNKTDSRQKSLFYSVLKSLAIFLALLFLVITIYFYFYWYVLQGI